MKQIIMMVLGVLALSACTVTADVPHRVTIDSDKVTIHRDNDHRHGDDRKHKYKYKSHGHKNKHCPYGQAKKGRC